ncbi:MAG: cobyrinate a,c-diamide synthase [Verrucomicrobia bacterium]|nr:cobyrinate a,c-diamide synthase [Verrucomicrobiota bacterium]
MNIPRIVIAGTQSGVGKTSLALGLVTLQRRRRLRVQTFKVGPDYLDPTYLTLASGRPCYNLDGWMTGESYVKQLFARACRDADIAVVEGVMGLFDGANPGSSEGSTAEIARWLDAPVVLVADVHGMARSLAAVVHGYATFDRDLRVAGVIANRCGSERHAQWLAESLQAAKLPPLLGSVRRDALPQLASRHLGLVTAETARISQQMLDKLADALAPGLSLDAVLQVAGEAPPLTEPGSAGVPPAGDGRGNEQGERSPLPAGSRASFACPSQAGGTPALPSAPRSSARPFKLGIAHDEAFHFYYPDNLEALEAAGCELVRFSPLRDRALPSNLDGLYLGGGYPEEHAAALAANGAMLDAIRGYANAGGPIYAECGGLMYLAEGIETPDGARHRLLGLLPAWTRMCPRRQSLGYVEVTLVEDSLWGRRGQKLRGHEFHYSELLGDPAHDSGWQTVYEASYRRQERAVREGFQRGSVLASYIHLHFASRPEAVRRFVRSLARP